MAFADTENLMGHDFAFRNSAEPNQRRIRIVLLATEGAAAHLVLVRILKRILLKLGAEPVGADFEHTLIELLLVGQLRGERFTPPPNEVAAVRKGPLLIRGSNCWHVQMNPGLIAGEQITAEVVDVQAPRYNHDGAGRLIVEPLHDFGIKPLRYGFEFRRIVKLSRYDRIVDYNQVKVAAT